MALKNFAYIFLSDDMNPADNTISTHSDDVSFTAVGINPKDKDEVINVAKKLAENGAQLIELCGGFGPTYVTKVREAIDNNNIAVGGVMYGPEYRQTLIDILKP